MRYQILFLFIILSFLIGCGPSAEPTKNTATNPNSNTNKSNSNLIPNTPTPTAKENDAPSIKPTIDGFYEALKRKDEAGVKKYLSAAALKYYETEAKAEKKTWFAFLLEAEEPVDQKREVRNEKITGEKAVAEVKGGPLGVFTPISFIKEDGAWKFDSPAVSLGKNDIQRTDTPTNKAK
jgi:hypothetical protein